MKAPGLVRCTDCRHAEELRGKWCEAACRYAGGRYLRRCSHHEPVRSEHALESLRALPGVVEAEHRDEELWLRFHRNASSEDCDTATELLTSRFPTLYVRARTGTLTHVAPGSGTDPLGTCAVDRSETR